MPQNKRRRSALPAIRRNAKRTAALPPPSRLAARNPAYPPRPTLIDANRPWKLMVRSPHIAPASIAPACEPSLRDHGDRAQHVHWRHHPTIQSRCSMTGIARSERTHRLRPHFQGRRPFRSAANSSQCQRSSVLIGGSDHRALILNDVTSNFIVKHLVTEYSTYTIG